MTDRADELARRLVRVLPDGDGHLGIDIAGTWFDWGSDMQAVADDITAKLAAAFRAYAEEARREERIIAAQHTEMRYEDGYACGVADKRAACAKLVEDHGHSNGRIRASHKHLAAAIRARREKR